MFNFNNGQIESELEKKALDGIPFSNSYFYFSYDEIEPIKRCGVNVPVYLLPIEVKNNVVSGHFRIDHKLTKIPISFSTKVSFSEDYRCKKYFSINFYEYFYLAQQDLLDREAINIRLSDTGYFVNFANFADSSRILGYEGIKGRYPLLLVLETEKEIIYLGFYKLKNEDPYMHYVLNHNNIQTTTIKGFFEEYFLPSIKRIEPELEKSPFTLVIGDSPTKRLNRINKNQQSEEKPKKTNNKKLESLVDKEKTFTDREIDWKEPRSIVEYLDRYVIGQENAKKKTAVAFSNFMIKYAKKDDKLTKNNILLIGPSGVGKTYMVSLLADKSSLPMVQTKLTGKSSEGYWGENLSGIFKQIREKTSGECPYGIIFIDEIDKITQDELGSRKGFGSTLQNELIGWLEDAKVNASKIYYEYNYLNTKNILFIAAGAFSGYKGKSSLANIIENRLIENTKPMEFRHNEHNKKNNYDLLLKVKPEDLIEYGLMPELVGRLTSIGVLQNLCVEEKIIILKKAEKSPLTDYKTILKYKGYGLEINDDALEVIVNHCPEETGARALSSVFDDLFTEIIYEPEKYSNNGTVIITPNLAENLIKLYK
ncbi:MAG: AAA family ATPase [Nanoarchaeota archaeon]